MSRDPAHRFPTVSDWVDALEGASRPRRFFPAVATVAGLGALGLALWIAPGDKPCSAAAEPVADVFDEAQRDRVRQRFEAVEPILAEETWVRVAEHVLSYRTALGQERVAACRATAVDGSQSDTALDLRIGCVDRRAARARALLRRLEQVDASGVPSSLHAVARLPDPAGCADPETAAAATDQAPAHIRAEVERMRGENDGLRALAALGQADLPRARRAIDELDGIDYAPLEADLRHTFARHLFLEAKFREAAVEDEAAFWLAVQARYSPTATRVARALASDYSAMSAHDEALEWSRVAEVLAEQQRDQVALGNALAMRASVQRRRAEYEAAERSMGRALELLGEADEHEVVLPDYWAVWAAIAYHQGRYDEALSRAQRAVAIGIESLGPRHPDVAFAYNALGGDVSGLGPPRRRTGMRSRRRRGSMRLARDPTPMVP